MTAVTLDTNVYVSALEFGGVGARLLGTLAHELRARGGRFGLATLCIGVGQGLATVIEAV